MALGMYRESLRPLECYGKLTRHLVAGAATAAAAAGLAYLDAKFHVRKDVSVLRGRSRMLKAYGTAGESARPQTPNCVANDLQVAEKRVSLWYFIEENVLAKGDREALWSRDGRCTWAELYVRSNQYANWFLSQGVRPGDLVGFMMVNSPEFPLAWIGLWAIGAAPAMINYHLPGPALLHCLKISSAKLTIVLGGPEVHERIGAVRSDVEAMGMKIVNLDQVRNEIGSLPPTRPGDHLREKVTGTDPYALFYTSGTTGMPKATFLPVLAGFSVRYV